MGLDITAYRQISPVSDVAPENADDLYETHWHPGASMKWSESEWPGRGEGVDADAVFTFAERFTFHAGSYSGYGQWRRALAGLFGKGQGRPFVELINFADNEGVIGSVVAAKLAKDFAEHDTAARGGLPDSFYEKYQEWRRAFEMAADGGAVDFH